MNVLYSTSLGNKTARVKHDRFDPDNYVVELYEDGVHYEPADYHTDDLDDAKGTADQMVGFEPEFPDKEMVQ